MNANDVQFPAMTTICRTILIFSAAWMLQISEVHSQERADVSSGLYQPTNALQSPPLRVEVLDGVRFRDIETHDVYRLYGVDACAPGQIANLGRQPWPCQPVAVAWLVKATLNRWVACNTIREEDGERLARCSSAEHADIAADMLQEGVVVATPPTTGDPAIRAYAAAESDARKAYRGLWGSSFESPRAYRDRLLSRSAAGAPPKDPP